MAIPAVNSSTSVNGSASTSSTASSGSASSTSSASLDYNTFLKLLLAQLKNQDPTKPMDSTEYMSQLASFSNVEQSIKMNTKLDNILTSQSLSNAENLIGKTVTNADSTIKGVVASVKVTQSGSVATLTDGKTVDLSKGVTVTSTPTSN